MRGCGGPKRDSHELDTTLPQPRTLLFNVPNMPTPRVMMLDMPDFKRTDRMKSMNTTAAVLAAKRKAPSCDNKRQGTGSCMWPPGASYHKTTACTFLLSQCPSSIAASILRSM